VVLDNILYITEALMLFYVANPPTIRATNIIVYFRYNIFWRRRWILWKKTTSEVRGEVKAL